MAPRTVQPGGERRRRVSVALAPVLGGLSAALALAIPPLGLFLLPDAAARTAAGAFRTRGPFAGFALATAVLPFAAILGVLSGSAGGGILAPVVATAFITLPALALYAGARDGRRRDELTLLVASVTGIGALAIVLGVVAATGKTPGDILAARLDAVVPDVLAMYRKAGWNESSLEAATSVFGTLRSLFARHLLGLVLGAVVLFAGTLVYPFGSRWGGAERDLEGAGFVAFRTPLAVTVAFVPIGVAAALAPDGIALLAVDLLAPLAVLFFLRGLAIIRALLDRGRAGLFLRGVVYFLVLQMPVPVVLAVGGLFDEFVDFRSRLGGTGGQEDPGAQPRG